MEGCKAGTERTVGKAFLYMDMCKYNVEDRILGVLCMYFQLQRSVLYCKIQ